VLTGIDLELSPGELLVVVGRSGCGKSTLLRLISGLEKPTEGEIAFPGVVQGRENEGVRMMFQSAALVPWRTVLQNVMISGPGGGLRDRAELALKQVGLLDRALDWPSALSGGQKQRVALARALASRPDILLLDEPLGALDALTRLEMQGLIENLWQKQGWSAILVTHDVEEAVALGDRVLVLRHGDAAKWYTVDLDRPRDRTLSSFNRLKQDVLRAILETD
jgi:sulfonate transport system ATP-binding protein